MTEGLFHSRLRAASRGLFWLGVAMLILGIAVEDIERVRR